MILFLQYQGIKKHQKRAIDKKIEEFVNMNTSGEQTMRIAGQILEDLKPNNDKLKINIWNKIKTKIKNLKT